MNDAGEEASPCNSPIAAGTNSGVASPRSGGADGVDGEESPKKKNKKEQMRLKVFARVRPAFPGEFNEKNGAFSVLELGEDRKTITLRDRHYEFDEVFPGESEQREIFQKVAKPTIDNAFDGFTGTVFVYGQTGTGKTHTMSNRAAEPEHQGIIPRAVSYLFERIAEDEGASYEVTLQYLQLYRDNLQDLQAPDTPFLKMENTPDGGTRINGVITSPVITSVDHFFEVYDAADKNRVVAETMMNKQSSRGHSVLTMFLKKAAKDNLSPAVNGKLVFVDLAGYERLKKTMITDEVRKHEAQAINLSLSALATCIAAITSKSSHVPFRNSRLTRILYDSLVGNSVTSVIITMGPSSLHTTETVNTLYFGHNAIQCKTSVKRDLGPVDWQKEAIQWKKRANELSVQVTNLETENGLLMSRLRASGGDVDLGSSSPSPTGSDVGRKPSLLSKSLVKHEGFESILADLQKTKQELEEKSYEVQRAEGEAEEAKVELEELSWTLERERNKIVEKEALEEELRREVEAQKQQAMQLTEQLEMALHQMAQIVPSEDLQPSTESTAGSAHVATTRYNDEQQPKRGLEPVFIKYDPCKYEVWSDLVTSELQRCLVKATQFDRAHWFVSVPDMAAFVGDDRRNALEVFSPREEEASPRQQRASGPPGVRIEGDAVCRKVLRCVTDESPPQDIRWEAGKNGYEFTPVPGGNGRQELHVNSELVHKYIRACVTLADGRRAVSGLVYANVPHTMDDQLQHFTVQGGVQFPVQHVVDDVVEEGRHALCIDCSGRVVIRSSNGHDITYDLTKIRAILVKPQEEGQERRVALLDEQQHLMTLETATPSDRELLVLTIRLFQALRQPWVAEALLGDEAECWRTGSWIRTRDAGARKTLRPRLRMVSRTGHWAADSQSPSRRAGGHSTFFQRAEELLDVPPRYSLPSSTGSRLVSSISHLDAHQEPASDFDQTSQRHSVDTSKIVSPASTVGTGARFDVISPAARTTSKRGARLQNTPRGTPAATPVTVPSHPLHRRGHILQLPPDSLTHKRGVHKGASVLALASSAPGWNGRPASVTLSPSALRAHDAGFSQQAADLSTVGSSDDETIPPKPHSRVPSISSHSRQR